MMNQRYYTKVLRDVRASDFIVLDDNSVIEGMYSTVFNKTDKGWEVRHFAENVADDCWCCYCGDDTHVSDECNKGLEIINSKEVALNIMFDLENKDHKVIFYNNTTGIIKSMDSEEAEYERT